MIEEIRQEFTQKHCQQRELIDLTKPELVEAIEDIKTWIENNISNFNQSIRLPHRTKLTARQKYHLFTLTVKKIWEAENG